MSNVPPPLDPANPAGTVSAVTVGLHQPPKDLPSSLLFIDGTNLDHRLHESFSRLDVDYDALFAKLSKGTSLKHVHYCTATYLGDPNSVLRVAQASALNYLDKNPRVTVHRGRHKPKTVNCRRANCSYTYTTYEEKRTDVHVASRLVHAACHKAADRLILVANDTDFEPAMRIAKEEGAHLLYGYVINPHKQRAILRQELDSLRRLAQKVIEIDEEWMDSCWRPPKSKK